METQRSGGRAKSAADFTQKKIGSPGHRVVGSWESELRSGENLREKEEIRS
jgi:hypothetical protein